MKSTARKNLAYSVKSAKYGTVESENDRVGDVEADSPEAKEDNHGTAPFRKRKKGGRVEGKKPRVRMDKHSDAAEDKKLIRKMVKSDDLKPERARGGAVKGKKGTTVNVIIAPQGGGAGAAVSRPPMPPPGAMPPPWGAMSPPPPAPVRPAMPMGGAGMAPTPVGMMRKAGGRVGESHKYPKMDAGAGNGEGRLEKIERYGANAKEKD